MSAKILGLDLATTLTASYAQLEGQATAGNLAALTKCNVCAVKREGLTQYPISRRLEATDKARARLAYPALHSTMANQDTAVIQEEESTRLTKKQTKHQMH